MHRSTPVLIAVALGLAAGAAAAERSEHVHLHKGKASMADAISGKDSISYVLKGKKRQELEIEFLPAGTACRFDLYAPAMAVPIYRGVAGASGFSGTLPESGDYRVKVHMTKGGKADCPFSISFRVRG